MRGQILEGIEAFARRADVDVTIEPAHGLAQGEVSGRPGTRPAEVAREEPVRRPLAEPTQRGQLRLHLVVGEDGQRREVEVGAREPDHVLGLAPRETEREELLRRRCGKPLTRRELPDPADALAPPGNPPPRAAAPPNPPPERFGDGGGRKERALLPRDRPYEHLERIRR